MTMARRKAFGAATALALALAVARATPVRADDFDADALVRLAAPPRGLPPVSLPPDNPATAAKISLGRKLFHDRRLSRHRTMSCAMCHVPEQAFTNNELATPIGTEGRSLRRNAPTLINVAYQRTIFHDGRETMLETQVISPLVAQDEMANPSIGYVLARIGALEDYDGLFERAFGGGPTIDRVGQAIASWERTLLAADSAFDRWRYGGDPAALDDQAALGFRLFVGKAGCAACHEVGETHALFTDHAFHDTGLGYYHDVVASGDAEPVTVQIAPGVFTEIGRAAVDSVGERRRDDQGRYEVTLRPEDRWLFKTPSLRNVAVTGPYMHNGVMTTLREVVEFYRGGGYLHPGLDPLIQPLDLTDGEVDALVAFMRSLTGSGIDALVADARSAPVGN
jgi:cytochrome c peroxidase